MRVGSVSQRRTRQVIPERLVELLTDEDEERANRAMAAMLEMGTIDAAALERAADGVPAA